MTLVGFKKMTIGVFDSSGKIPAANLYVKVNKTKGRLYLLKSVGYQKNHQKFTDRTSLTMYLKKEQAMFQLHLVY